LERVACTPEGYRGQRFHQTEEIYLKGLSRIFTSREEERERTETRVKKTKKKRSGGENKKRKNGSKEKKNGWAFRNFKELGEGRREA